MSTYSVIYHTDPYQHRQAREAEGRQRRQRAVRTRQLRRRCLVTMMILFFLFSAGIAALGKTLQADPVQASAAKTEAVYYTSIQVEEGDTLWEIAEEYRDMRSCSKREYIETIKELNHLSGYQIESGEYLLIPCVKTVSEL